MPPNVDVLARLTDAAAAWALTYLVHSTLMLVGAWVLTARTRMSDAVRGILWKSALVGGIATATIQTAITPAPLGGQVQLSPRTAPPTPTMRVTVQDGVPGIRPELFVLRSHGTRWTAGFAVIWMMAAGFGLLWLTRGHARTLALLDDRRPLDDSPIGEGLRDLLGRVGVDRDITLSCSSRIASPVALTGGEICLPRRALVELETAEQESMLAHEVAHLVRRDPEWLVVARAIEVVLFFQPLNRIARHRMQEVAEFLCDDWAVARTSRPVTLAKCLAAVAEWVARAPRTAPRLQPLSAMVESSGSPLVRRVGRILSDRAPAAPRSSRMALAASVCALVGLATVAPRVSVVKPVPRERGFVVVESAVTAAGAVNRLTLRRDTVILCPLSH